MMRAYVVNKLFQFSSIPQLNLENKGVVFQAINMFDRYFHMMATKGIPILLSEGEFSTTHEAKLLKKFVSRK